MHPPGSQLRRHDAFHSGFLEHDRDVLVWLPPGYDAGAQNRRYPVLYMHDGQNLFEPDTAFQKGEHWRLGETAAALIEDGSIEPLIIVGIYNTGTHRKEEYTPTHDATLGGGLADDYGRMIVEELKPFIDRTYRTRPEPQHTGLGGSSLGGLVTLYLGFTHPQVFGRLAVLSPSVWWNWRAILKTVRQSRAKPLARVGRHGHRRRQAWAGRCEAAQGGAGRAGIRRRGRPALRRIRRRHAHRTRVGRTRRPDAQVVIPSNLLNPLNY